LDLDKDVREAKKKEREKKREEAKRAKEIAREKGTKKEKREKLKEEIDLTDMTDEEIDEWIAKEVAGDSEKKKDKDDNAEEKEDDDEENEDIKRVKEEMEELAEEKNSLTEKLENAKKALKKRMETYAELQEELEMAEEQNDIQAPYIDAIKSDKHLKQAVTALAKMSRADDEEAKGQHKEEFIDSIYELLEKETGIPIREKVDSDSRKKKNTVQKKKGNFQSVKKSDDMDDVDRGIAQALR
jgi:hypothetical protein